MQDVVYTSVRGKQVAVRAVKIGGVNVLLRGRFIKTAQIFDEYWVERDSLPSPDLVAKCLMEMADRPDLFVFAQRVPDSVARYNYYHELENYAVLPLLTFEHWLTHQIPSATRRNIRASEKRGISIQVCEFNTDYVKGISSIYNETPFRAGRGFWHYGKDLETVRRENGTYITRSLYLAAFRQGEMVGYLRLVLDKSTAAIMQILSKTAVRDCRTNNALMAEAVKLCCARGIEYLLYEKFDYGKKTGDSLTRFKQSNGFVRMDIPRYYVPLTAKGSIALRLGLHTRLKDRLPEWMASRLRELRRRLYERKQAAQ